MIFKSYMLLSDFILLIQRQIVGNFNLKKLPVYRLKNQAHRVGIWEFKIKQYQKRVRYFCRKWGSGWSICYYF